MRRGIHPLAVLLLAAVVVGAVVLGFFIKGRLPGSWSQWSDLIFWGMIIVVGGTGAWLIGKLFGRK